MTPTAAASTDGLLVQHLQKTYVGRQVVQDVSISVSKGEVVGLLGPNGAGKTTSFYMIVGLVRADGGTISIDGVPVEHLPIHLRARMGLSYLPQEASIFRKLNVADNVRAVLELQKDAQGKSLTKTEIEQRLTGLLQELRIEHLRESAALALSGGERRRVEIARALAKRRVYRKQARCDRLIGHTRCCARESRWVFGFIRWARRDRHCATSFGRRA